MVFEGRYQLAREIQVQVVLQEMQGLKAYPFQGGLEIFPVSVLGSPDTVDHEQSSGDEIKLAQPKPLVPYLVVEIRIYGWSVHNSNRILRVTVGAGLRPRRRRRRPGATKAAGSAERQAPGRPTVQASIRACGTATDSESPWSSGRAGAGAGGSRGEPKYPSRGPAL